MSYSHFELKYNVEHNILLYFIFQIFGIYII